MVVVIDNICQATVAYYLLLDNRFRVSSGYLGAEFQETMVFMFFFWFDKHVIPFYTIIKSIPTTLQNASS